MSFTKHRIKNLHFGALLLIAINLQALQIYAEQTSNEKKQPALNNTKPAKYYKIFSSAERAWLKKHPRIRFAPAPNYPPVEFFDKKGVYRGITADFVHYIKKEFGISFEIVHMKSWNNVVAHAKARKIEDLKMHHESQQIPVTVSIGITVMDPSREQQNLAQLFQLADQALYKAKKNGRNRIEINEKSAAFSPM